VKLSIVSIPSEEGCVTVTTQSRPSVKSGVLWDKRASHGTYIVSDYKVSDYILSDSCFLLYVVVGIVVSCCSYSL
jgi:hypothetical protein